MRLMCNCGGRVLYSPFSAITLLAGFMIAESALMGRRMGLAESFMSMMTTWLAPFTFSRTQMNLSDSIVSVLNEIEFALIPAAVSCHRRGRHKGRHEVIKNIIIINIKATLGPSVRVNRLLFCSRTK